MTTTTLTRPTSKPEKKNLLGLFDGQGRKEYKPQSKNDKWIVFRSWVKDTDQKVLGSYIGICKDKGDDAKTLRLVCEGVFYEAKRKNRRELEAHPYHHALHYEVFEKNQIDAEVLHRCRNRPEALKKRREYIQSLDPNLNKPGYIRAYVRT